MLHNSFLLTNYECSVVTLANTLGLPWNSIEVYYRIIWNETEVCCIYKSFTELKKKLNLLHNSERERNYLQCVLLMLRMLKPSEISIHHLGGLLHILSQDYTINRIYSSFICTEGFHYIMIDRIKSFILIFNDFIIIQTYQNLWTLWMFCIDYKLDSSKCSKTDIHHWCSLQDAYCREFSALSI